MQFLEGVIVQGFLSLLEKEVTVHAREKDVHVAQKAAANAARAYGDISGRAVKPTVHGVLSDELCVDAVDCWRMILTVCCSAGGVKLISGNSRITIDNTLDERLRLLEDRVRLPICQCIPA